MRRILIWVLANALLSCQQTNDEVYPSCFQLRINVVSPPIEIWRYNYQGQLVYLVVPDCCDQYISLYDETCKYMCAPSGGLTGKGDGKCPDFYDKATNGTLVWKKK